MKTLLHPKQVEFVELLKEFDSKHETRKVFLDFLEIALIFLHQIPYIIVFGERNEQLEQKYLGISGSYSQEDAAKILPLLSLVIEGLEDMLFQDFLGAIYEHLGFTDERKGQFFTPPNIAKLMAKMTFDASSIHEKGYTTCSDPACESGITLISFAEEMYNQGFDLQTQLIAYGNDISFPAVCMTYIQTTVLGIPATITHGDALAKEVYSTWTNIHLR